MAARALETDYLIIGAGASGLCFADEMLSATPDTHITIVDRRHACGGHWNDAYSFVRLHQPSVFYGVGSMDLGDDRLDESGVNKGFMNLAEGPEILAYFHRVMRDRLLPSGRVAFHPLSQVTEAGDIRHVLSGETQSIRVRRKVIDASYYENSVPRTHTRKFEVADGVTCVAPNDLPRLAARFRHYTVLGAGKTGMDSCVWLLTNGVPPERVSWVVPRDPWMLNRAFTQPGEAFFMPVFTSFLHRQQAVAEATSATDLAHRFEASKIWLRLDPDIEPELFHAPTISEGELEVLRSIGSNIIRKGRVTRLEPKGMVLTKGEAAVKPDTLFIDCTAGALVDKPALPIYDGDRITLQMVRFPQIPFSSAIAAYIEATIEGEEAQNQLMMPMKLPDSVPDFVRTLLPDMMNRFHCGRNRDVREWIVRSRLDGYARIARDVSPDDTEKRALLDEIRTASFAAAENIPKLVAACEGQ